MTSTTDGATTDRRAHADENLAPPVTRGRSKTAQSNQQQAPVEPSSETASTSSATTSRVPNAGLMLQKLNHLIRCFADSDSGGVEPTAPTASTETPESSNQNNNNGESTGPQTRNRGRAEKLKSRWIDMVLTNSHQNGLVEMALPPAPVVRDVPLPVFPEGHSPEFEFITENQYIASSSSSAGSSRSRKVEKRMTCECTFTPEMAAEGRLGCTSPTDCLNRMLYVECGSRCSAGDYCANKRFQRREYANLQLFDAGSKGLGVLAAKTAVEPGDFLLEYVGEVIDFDQFRSRLKRYSKAGRKHWFFMALSSEQYLDATLKGNLSRYINHSCDPNAEMQKWTVNGQVRIGFFARRRIEPGDEVTLDYQFETYGEKVQTCFCGSTNCRGYIGKLVAPVGTLVSAQEQGESEEDDDFALNSNNKRNLVADRRKAVELGDKIEKLAVDPACLRSPAGLLDLCRLMVRAESREHRTSLVALLRNQVSESALGTGPKLDQFAGDFIRLHGLDVLWSWLVDEERSSPRNETTSNNNGESNSSSPSPLSLQILHLLDSIPMPNRNVVDDSQLFSFVERLTLSNEVDQVKLLACQLMTKWSTLKQLFRIPRMVVSQSSRVQTGFNKQQLPETSPISLSGQSGSVWASSFSNSRFSRSLFINRAHQTSSPANSRHHWQNHNGSSSSNHSSNGGGGVSDNSMTKEQRRKMFEQAMLEEEQTRRRQLEIEEEEARRLSLSLNHSTSCLVFQEDSNSTSPHPDLQTPTIQIPMTTTTVTTNSSAADQEAAAIAEMIAAFDLDLAAVFGEISQLLSDPLMADIDATTNNEQDSEQLIMRLSSFPQITKLISLLSADSNNNEVSNDKTLEKEDEEIVSASATTTMASPQLPPGWSSAVDSESGRTYYYNRSTNKTQWEMPNGVISPSGDSNGSGGGKKRVSVGGDIGTVVAKQRRKRNRPCEIHNVFDDCSPYLDESEGIEVTESSSNSATASPLNKTTSRDTSFRHDLGKYIAKLLRPYYCKDQPQEDKVLIRSSDEFKEICRKWTESIYVKERARTKHHHLELNDAIKAKVQSFVDKYVESMRKKQQKDHHHH